MLFTAIPAGYVIAMTVWIVVLATGFVLLLKARCRARDRPRRLRVLHLSLALCTFLAAVTAAELYFAIFYDGSDSLNMTNVSKRWTARHVQRNEEGFRDARPLTPHVEDGRKRILFVGDSFTFGQGVANPADRFGDRIGAALEQARPGRYVVANAGVSGYSTVQIAPMVAEALGRKYEMKYVVYTICLNDIDGFYADVNQLYQTMEPRRPTVFLFRDTYFLNLLYFHAQQYTIPELRMYDALLRQWYAGAEWRRMQESLQSLQATCRNAGVELRVAVFPMVHLLGPSYPLRDIHRQITDFCTSQGIRTLDLEPALTPHVHDGLRASVFDVHPSAVAHRLAADAMRESLLDDLFQTDNSIK